MSNPEREYGWGPSMIGVGAYDAIINFRYQVAVELFKQEECFIMALRETTQRSIGGAPTQPSTLPDDAQARKEYPIYTGVLEYFPDAIVALAHVSWQGGNQHHPGKPLHWDRSKSTDEADTMLRHFMQQGTRDIDGIRHTAKAAWRLLALLQKEIEAE